MLPPTALSKHLSVEHRAYVALYAIQLNQSPRQAILTAYEVTETDLARYRPAWEELQANRADRNRPLPRVTPDEGSA